MLVGKNKKMNQRHINKTSRAILGDGRSGVGMYSLKAWDLRDEQRVGRLEGAHAWPLSRMTINTLTASFGKRTLNVYRWPSVRQPGFSEELSMSLFC